MTDRYPDTRKKAVKLVLFAVVIYCFLAAVLASVGDTQRDGCDRGNDRNLSTYIDLRADAADERALAGQTHDPEQAEIHDDIADRKDDRADGMLADAEATGFQDSADVPTLSCGDVYPNPLPWIS